MHKIDVYTLTGHLCIIAGSKAEAVLIADILFISAFIYKVKVFESVPGLPAVINAEGGKLVYELI